MMHTENTPAKLCPGLEQMTEEQKNTNEPFCQVKYLNKSMHIFASLKASHAHLFGW